MMRERTDARHEHRMPGDADAEQLRLWMALAEQTARAELLSRQLSEIRSSRSWRLTSGMRRFAAWMRGPEPRAGLRLPDLSSEAAPPQLLSSFAPEMIQTWVRRTQCTDLATLLVDVTEVDLEDLGAGIQRVTRHVLLELISTQSQVRVVPVRLSVDGRYCPAWRFSERLLGLPEGLLGAEPPIAVGPDDCFLGLDFCRRHHAAFGLAIEHLRQAGARIMVMVYDLLPCTHPHWFPDVVAADYRKWLQHAARCDVAICISETTREALTRVLAEEKLPFPGSAAVVPLGADALPVFPRTKASANAKVLLVGTVEPRKGHADALDAMERLWSRDTAVDLVIVGRPGWHSRDLQQRIVRHREYGRRLVWESSAADTNLARHYAEADLLVMASEGEGYGLPLAEAGRAGCRLIARDLPIFREVAATRASYFCSSQSLEASVDAFLRDPAGWPDPQAPAWNTWRESALAIMAHTKMIGSEREARRREGVSE
ncbi:glycosyltransferase [Lysobacter soli]|uniref:glycosyltransferase n=1 Tax=Lysobacter soli TaxID=453783 RepID=UPI0037C69A89